jgi:predicted nucleic acid-binding protein
MWWVTPLANPPYELIHPTSCDTLWSEDMQHGIAIEGLRIVNPFHVAG